MTDLSAEYQALAAYRPTNKVRFVTAASLFDGHDAAINIMRRILQGMGAEVIHLGHNRSVDEVVTAALQEDVQGIALSSYQGGHVEYFKYMVDLLRQRGGAHIQVFGGGGGVIVPEEIDELHAYGVARIFSPEDGAKLGLQPLNDAGSHADFFSRLRLLISAISRLSAPAATIQVGRFSVPSRRIRRAWRYTSSCRRASARTLAIPAVSGVLNPGPCVPIVP